MLSKNDLAAQREKDELSSVFLDYSDMEKLDQYVHQLFSDEATLDDLPQDLKDDYRIRQEENRYVIERTATDKVISSGPSRYVYHYYAALVEQF